jgi:hypothetical protein
MGEEYSIKASDKVSAVHAAAEILSFRGSEVLATVIIVDGEAPSALICPVPALGLKMVI